MREVVARGESGDPEARLARDVYLHRLRGGIAAMAATLGGLDTLVFTGGVGENNSQIRASTAAGLAFLGVGIDDPLNRDSGDREITAAAGAATRTLVIRAREDLEIAAQVSRLLASDPSA
jgi:acetate kinase